MLSHRKGVLLDGIGSELVRAAYGGIRRTLSTWLGYLVSLTAQLSVENYAALTALTSATGRTANGVYWVRGRTSANDGGHGFFWYSAASSATADSGSILTPDDSTGRYIRLHDGRSRPEWFGSSSAWGAAITLAAVNFSYLKFTPGVTYTWSDSQVAIDKSGFVLDCRGATLRPTYASGYAIKFGTGSTARVVVKIKGGIWNQRTVADGGVSQGLFDLRGVEQVYMDGCYGQNIYQLARWGLAADAQDSYQWWHTNCKWVMRTNANGGHTDAILADGSAGGYYEARTYIEGDSANVSGTQAVIKLTSAQGPTRFDGLQRDGGNHKGFDHSILVNDARIVNIDYSNSARTDDMQSYGFRLDVSSGAAKGGCEGIHLEGQFGGLGPGGALYISNASASLGCTDITIDAHSTNATSTICKFETTGSGTIKHAHVKGLDVDDCNPADANQDLVVFDGDVDSFSADNINVGYKAGASFTARRIVYDNTAGTKIGLIGTNIFGSANTAVVTRTNAGTTAGRHNWIRTDGTPVGAWSSATDRLFGRDTASAGPAEEITVGGGIEFTGSAGIQTSAFTGDATKTAGGTALTLATVNSNVGSFGGAAKSLTATANAKGLITAIAEQNIALPSAQIVMSATDKIVGRVSASGGAAEEVTFTDQAQALCDDTSFQAMCATLGTWRVLAVSGAALSHTGDTNKTTLVTIAVPAAAMGANGVLRITCNWSFTNSGNNKTLGVDFGGTSFMAWVQTTNAAARTETQITNRNATNSQVSSPANMSGFGGTANSTATGAIDTTSSQNITIAATLANSGETITLEAYLVELLYSA